MIFLLSLVLILIFSFYQSKISILLSYLLFSLILIPLFKLNSIASKLSLLVYSLSSIFSIILFFIFINDYGLPYSAGGSDELTYEEIGKEFALNYGFLQYGSIRNNLGYDWHNSVGYIYITGLMYKLGSFFDGFHTLIPRLFNCLCLSYITFFIYLTANKLGLKPKNLIYSSLIVGLYPLMMWVTVQTLRDIIQSLLLVIIVYLWIPNKFGKFSFPFFLNLLLTVLILIPVWEMRNGQAFVGVFFVIISIFLYYKNLSIKNKLFVFLPVGILFIFLFIDLNNSLFSDIEGIFLGAEIYTQGRSGEWGTGGGLSKFIFEKQLFPFGWIYRVVYALISPLPIAFVSIDYAFMSIGSIFQIIYLPFLFIGIYYSFFNKKWIQIFLIFLLLFLGMSMFTFTIRHICQYLPFAVLLIFLGIEQSRVSRNKIIYSMFIIEMILISGYFIIKN